MSKSIMKVKGRRGRMLKIRLMGTKKDIKWLEEILKNHPEMEVIEFSDLYSSKGTNRYYRAYAEVEKSKK